METNTMALIQTGFHSGHHDSSIQWQAVFLCTADKLQFCHMLTCWTQQTQPSPTFIQHSFEQWVQLLHQVLSFENSHWAGLGRILGRCLCNHRKTLMSSLESLPFLFPWQGFPWPTYIKQVGWKQGCKLMDQIQTVDCIAILLLQPWEVLVPWKRTPWHWSKQVKFRPSRLFHKGCLPLHSCQTGNFATCWHVELSKLSLLQHSFNIHSSNGFSCPIKFFHLKIAIGLALGKSWGVAARSQKNTDVQCLPFPISVGRLSLANLQKTPSSKHSCKLMDQI